MTRRKNMSRVAPWISCILAVPAIVSMLVLFHVYIQPLHIWPIFYLVILPLAIFSPIVSIFYRTNKTIPISHFLISAIVFIGIGFFIYILEKWTATPFGIGFSIFFVAIIILYLVFLTINLASPEKEDKNKKFLERHFDILISNPEVGLWVTLFLFVTIANFSGLAIFFIDKQERESGGWGIHIDKALYAENRITRRGDAFKGSNGNKKVYFCEREYDFIYIDKDKSGGCTIPRKYIDHENELGT